MGSMGKHNLGPTLRSDPKSPERRLLSLDVVEMFVGILLQTSTEGPVKGPVWNLVPRTILYLVFEP